MFSLLELCLHRVKAFSASPLIPSVRRVGVEKELEGTQQTPTEQGMSHTTWCHIQHLELREDGRRGCLSYGICLPKSPLQVTKPDILGDSRTPACPWEVATFFALLADA